MTERYPVTIARPPRICRSHMSASQSSYSSFFSRRTWRCGANTLLNHLGWRATFVVGVGAFLIAGAGCTDSRLDRVDYPHNPIEFSAAEMAVILVAASPYSSCRLAQASQLHLFKTYSLPGQKGNKWVGSFNLNADFFKSDLPTQRIFVQAFQLDPGDYRLDLRVLPTGSLPNRQPYASAMIRLSAGEVRYIGTLESHDCGDSTRIHLSTDWAHFNPTFQRIFPGLPADSIKVLAPPFGIERSEAVAEVDHQEPGRHEPSKSASRNRR